jgi:hypothetical protein
VGCLGLVSLAAGLAATIISLEGREIPPFIAGLGTSAVSVLGTLAIAFYRPSGGSTAAGDTEPDGSRIVEK